MGENDWMVPVRAALTASDRDDSALRLLIAVPDEVMRQSDWETGAELIPDVIAVLEREGLPAWRHLMVLGISQFRVGETTYRATLERSAAQASTPVERAQALGNLARTQRMDGLLPDALRTSQVALAIYRSEDNEIGVAQTNADIAAVQLLLGDDSGAIGTICSSITNLIAVGQSRLAESVRREALHTSLRDHPRVAEIVDAGLDAESPVATLNPLPGDSSGVSEPSGSKPGDGSVAQPIPVVCLADRVAPCIGVGLDADPHPIFEALNEGQWIFELSELTETQFDELEQEVELLVAGSRGRTDTSLAHHVSAMIIRNRPKETTVSELRRAVVRAKIACRLEKHGLAPERAVRWLSLSNLYHDLADHDSRYLTFALAAMRRSRRAALGCDESLRAHVDAQYANLLILRGSDDDYRLAATLLNSALRFAFNVGHVGLIANTLNRLAALFGNWTGDDRVINLQQADRHYRFAIELAEQQGNQGYAATLKHQRANVLRAIGGSVEVVESRRLYSEALVGLADVPGAWASVADDFAGLLEETGDEPAAIEMRGTAVEMLRRHGTSADLAIALGNLGSRHADISDEQADVADVLASLRSADDAYIEALDTEYARSPSKWRALQLRRRGLIRQRLAFYGGGNLADAIYDFADAYQLALRYEPVDAVVTYAEVYGDVLAVAGRFAEAYSMYLGALEGYGERYVANLSPSARLETVEAALGCARSAASCAFANGEFEVGLAHLEVWPGRLLGGLSTTDPERRAGAIDALGDTMRGDLVSGAIARDIIDRSAMLGNVPPAQALRADLEGICSTHDVVIVVPTRWCATVAVLLGSADPGDLAFACVEAEPGTIVDAIHGLLGPKRRPTVLIDQTTPQVGLHTYPSRTGASLIDDSPVVHHHSLRAAAASRLVATPLTNHQAVGDPPSDLKFAAAEIAASSALIAASASNLGVSAMVSPSELISGGVASGSIIHLACHGRPHFQPLATALLFAQESLTVADLLRSQVGRDAGLIIVSSCESAVSGSALVSEPFNVAAALHSSGIPTIGTFEPVDDLAAALLVVRFFEELIRTHEDIGSGPDALANAQRWLRASSSHDFTVWLEQHEDLRAAVVANRPDFPDPDAPDGDAPFARHGYWAPFAYFGW